KRQIMGHLIAVTAALMPLGIGVRPLPQARYLSRGMLMMFLACSSTPWVAALSLRIALSNYVEAGTFSFLQILGALTGLIVTTLMPFLVFKLFPINAGGDGGAGVSGGAVMGGVALAERGSRMFGGGGGGQAAAAAAGPVTGLAQGGGDSGPSGGGGGGSGGMGSQTDAAASSTAGGGAGAAAGSAAAGPAGMVLSAAKTVGDTATSAAQATTNSGASSGSGSGPGSGSAPSVDDGGVSQRSQASAGSTGGTQ
ncbi:MAG: hypothetical protein ABMA25_23490, partial [Ilumatobacteraceae bacterium]